jgi:putative transposase
VVAKKNGGGFAERGFWGYSNISPKQSPIKNLSGLRPTGINSSGTRSLKYEWTNHESFANLEEARLSVFRYIETFYNSERIHETLGYLSPDDYEAEHAPTAAA